MHSSKSVYVALANYFVEFGYDQFPVPKSAISTIEFATKTGYRHHFGRNVVKKTENVVWSGGLLRVAEDCGASCALTSRPSSHQPAGRRHVCLSLTQTELRVGARISRRFRAFLYVLLHGSPVKPQSEHPCVAKHRQNDANPADPLPGAPAGNKPESAKKGLSRQISDRSGGRRPSGAAALSGGLSPRVRRLEPPTQTLARRNADGGDPLRAASQPIFGRPPNFAIFNFPL